ncbi:hypothetical protein ACFQL1_15155 [Halomicroarcula sp. GCM10025709]|uniref:DUF7287 family protein n=1 Tax=Haloarcula TaxID=2237 RepID=UPI0024C3511D|nr:hypothetical protein [Halomicroarcula sp. YJ-61-S]
MSRGQTTLDFAVGISLFLAIVLFIFLFVPGILTTFTAGSPEETVTANRVADDLSLGLLGSPAEPNVWERECAVAFFDGTTPSGCNFAGSTTNERLGLAPRESVNVTVAGNVSADPDPGSDRLCWDDSAGTLDETDSGCAGTNDVVLTAGDDAPSTNADSVTATRVVSLHGEAVTVEVVMW